MSANETQTETKSLLSPWFMCEVKDFDHSRGISKGSAYCRRTAQGDFEVCTPMGRHYNLSQAEAPRFLVRCRRDGKLIPANASEVCDIEAGRMVSTN